MSVIKSVASVLKKILQFKICKKKINYSKLNPKNWKRSSFKKIARGFAFLLIFLAAIIIVKDEYNYQFGHDSYDSEALEEGYSGEDSGESDNCNVSGIELRGDVVTYINPSSLDKDGNIIEDETSSEGVVYQIDEAEADNSIKAIIIEVDSYGGSPVAAEEIANAIKRATKPTVVLVRGAATSAAYWASTGANIIFASALSDIGSIGVTMSYLDYTKKNSIEGLTYNSLSVGKFKDYGDPDKPLTAEEKVLLMRDLNIAHNIFIKAVADNRKLDINKVKALADGSSMPGEMALENGLIDKIGGMKEVKEYLKDKIGKEVELCWPN